MSGSRVQVASLGNTSITASSSRNNSNHHIFVRCTGKNKDATNLLLFILGVRRRRCLCAQIVLLALALVTSHSHALGSSQVVFHPLHACGERKEVCVYMARATRKAGRSACLQLARSAHGLMRGSGAALRRAERSEAASACSQPVAAAAAPFANAISRSAPKPAARNPDTEIRHTRTPCNPCGHSRPTGVSNCRVGLPLEAKCFKWPFFKLHLFCLLDDFGNLIARFFTLCCKCAKKNIYSWICTGILYFMWLKHFFAIFCAAKFFCKCLCTKVEFRGWFFHILNIWHLVFVTYYDHECAFFW